MRSYQIILLGIFLVVSLVIRFIYLDYSTFSLTYSDSYRDYLIADHIITYKGIPLIGHYNFFFEHIGFRSSPVYYYILAIFLIPFNSMLSLSVINVLLQVAALALVFFITRSFFGFRASIMAAILFGIMPFVFGQSENIWQPWVMQTTALLALYFLSQSYIKRRYIFLIVSNVLLVLALSIHLSAATWLPIFILLSFLVLKLENKKIIYYAGILAAIFFTTLFLHIPVIILYSLNNGFWIDPRPIYPQSVTDYFLNLTNYFQILYLNPFVMFILIIALIGFLILKKEKRNITLFGLSLLIIPLLAASFFQHPVHNTGHHYITVSFSISVITISVVVNFYFDRIRDFILSLTSNNHRKSNIVIFSCWLIIFILLIMLFSQNFSILNKSKIKNKGFLLEEAVGSIQKKVFEIKQNEGFNNLDFFKIVSYTNRRTFSDKTQRLGLEDTWLLMPLEKKLDYKLVNAAEDVSYLEQTNRDDYVFLACFDRFKCSKSFNCTQDFLKARSNYSLIERIYNTSTLSIFLLKKKT